MGFTGCFLVVLHDIAEPNIFVGFFGDLATFGILVRTTRFERVMLMWLETLLVQ